MRSSHMGNGIQPSPETSLRLASSRRYVAGPSHVQRTATLLVTPLDIDISKTIPARGDDKSANLLCCEQVGICRYIASALLVSSGPCCLPTMVDFAVGVVLILGMYSTLQLDDRVMEDLRKLFDNIRDENRMSNDTHGPCCGLCKVLSYFLAKQAPTALYILW
jgi:hypothetical protein